MNKDIQRYVAKKGYWSVYPRYRGTWESGGEFLARSPYEDIKDVIEGLGSPMTSEWDGNEYRIENPEIYVVGTSFGGPAAIFASGHPAVKAAIAIAPVVDWSAEKLSTEEPMEWVSDVTKRAFGEAYRYSKDNWERLSRAAFYNPVTERDAIDPNKLLILHAEDDSVVLYPPVAAFAKEIGCTFVSKKKGGHLGTGSLRRWQTRGRLFSFLRNVK